jgi:hypothetical protein
MVEKNLFLRFSCLRFFVFWFFWGGGFWFEGLGGCGLFFVCVWVVEEFVFAGVGVDEFVFEEFAEGFEDFFGFFACLVGDFLEG